MKEIKFKVGDIVVAKKNNGYSITSGNKNFVGEVVYIDYHYNYIDVKPVSCDDDDAFQVSTWRSLRPEAFELKTIVNTPQPEKTIIEVIDEKTMRGTVLLGDKTIKVAYAYCNDTDTFDYSKGAKLVLERLGYPMN